MMIIMLEIIYVYGDIFVPKVVIIVIELRCPAVLTTCNWLCFFIFFSFRTTIEANDGAIL